MTLSGANAWSKFSYGSRIDTPNGNTITVSKQDLYQQCIVTGTESEQFA